jgi:hypothetical protein
MSLLELGDLIMNKLETILRGVLRSFIGCFVLVMMLYSQPCTVYSFGQGAESHRKKYCQVPLDQELPEHLFDNPPKKKEWIEHVNTELQSYGNEIFEANGNIVMLRYPHNWYKIIRLTPNITEVSDEGEVMEGISIYFVDNSAAGVNIIVNNDTKKSLFTTIMYSAQLFVTSQRQSTWGLGKSFNDPDFERVNFASYYYPLDFSNTYHINSQNITITLYGKRPSHDEKEDNNEQIKHFRSSTAVQIVNGITSLFIEPAKDRKFKESNDMILKVLEADKWSQEKKGYCEIEWEVKNELKDSWVILRSTYGTISIISPDKSLTSNELDEIWAKMQKNEKYERIKNSSHVYRGIVALSGMDNRENILTMYAVSADGKTWYRQQVTIDPKKFIKKPVYEYRSWESLDGRYTIEAKLISVTVGKDDKRYVTLERQDNSKKTTVPLDQLSKPDQEYMQLQIDKQENKK